MCTKTADEYCRFVSHMLTSKQMIDDNSRHDGFPSTWHAWTEQRSIFRPIPSLELCVL
jgi:hypothetical protein